MPLILVPPYRKLAPTYYAGTPILFRFDNGPLNSSSFVNEGASPAALSISGTPKMISSPRRFGNFAGDFRTGHIQTAAHMNHRLGANDFTIEFWVYCTGLGTFETTALCGLNAAASGTNWMITMGNGNYNGNPYFGVPRLQRDGPHWGLQLPLGVGAIALNTWIHFSITRVGAEIYCHKNGTYQGVTAGIWNIGAGIPIEADANDAPVLRFGNSGSIILDDVRIQTGSALRGKTNFTPVAI